MEQESPDGGSQRATSNHAMTNTLSRFSSLLLNLMLASGLLVCAARVHATEIYAGYGTTGLELGVGQTVSPMFGARAEIDLQNWSRSLSSDDTTYRVRFKVQRLALLGDMRLFSSTRLTAGALIGSTSLDGQAQVSNGTIRINNHDYPAAGQSLSMEAKFPKVSPYIGIGGGHFATEGLSFNYDVGAAFGRPKVSLTASPGLLAQAGQANVDAEQRSAQRTADRWKAFPVLRAGFGYAF